VVVYAAKDIRANAMNSYSINLDLGLQKKLAHDLESQGFEFSCPQYTLFQAKKPGLTVTLYQSGKLMVQGKGSTEFVQFYLEPELLQSIALTHPHAQVDMTARIGVDEAGKGDFFGPLCIASVYGGEKEIAALIQIGVKDSKTMQDSTIRKMAEKIKKTVPCHVVRIGPAKYNEIYPKFGNLNLLLAWGHATAIEALVKETDCKRALVDQFSDRPHVLTALKRKGIDISLEQRTKAESDPVVAAASILARDAFLTGMDKLSKECGTELPKGASAKVTQAATKLAREQGISILESYAKTHFKTMKEIDAIIRDSYK
jgi:ribonuclease HIII